MSGRICMLVVAVVVIVALAVGAAAGGESEARRLAAVEAAQERSDQLLRAHEARIAALEGKALKAPPAPGAPAAPADAAAPSAKVTAAMQRIEARIASFQEIVRQARALAEQYVPSGAPSHVIDGLRRIRSEAEHVIAVESEALDALRAEAAGK